MHVGVGQIDITPPMGGQLSGFASRSQLSTGVYDPLYARALYLEQQHRRLLWAHVDLIGLHSDTVRRFRDWASDELGLDHDHILLTASHTHAGPATFPMLEAGDYDAAYMEDFFEKLCEVADLATIGPEPCELVAVEGECHLAIDRRGGPGSHVDPRVGAVGWRDGDGQFVAVVCNYAMHPVALGPKNHHISADVPGQIAAHLSEQLPGEPIVLATIGACGNLNPPELNVAFDQIESWGSMIASAIALPLCYAEPQQPMMSSKMRTIELPIDGTTADEIDRMADRAWQLMDAAGEWGERFSRVVEHWRAERKRALKAGQNSLRVETAIVRIGPTCWVGIGSEVFSQFADLIREGSDVPTYVVGCANGLTGYLPTRLAYDQGGYEIEHAQFFYDNFRPQSGALEQLAKLIRSQLSAATIRS